MIYESKRVEYKGFYMRSILEMEWAKFFDKHNMEWFYEPEGYNFEGVSYLPDFYLPEQDIYFEVKGIMTRNDKNKIRGLVYYMQKKVIVGYQNGTFEIVQPSYNGKKVNWIFGKGGSHFFQCPHCYNYYFATDDDIWTCGICGKNIEDGYWMDSAWGKSDLLIEVRNRKLHT